MFQKGMKKIVFLALIINSLFFSCSNDNQLLIFEENELFDLVKALTEAKKKKKSYLYFLVVGLV